MQTDKEKIIEKIYSSILEGSTTPSTDIVNESKIIFGFPGTKHTFLNTHKSKSVFEPREQMEFKAMRNYPRVKENPLEGVIELRGFYQEKIQNLPPGQKTIDYERDTHATVSSVVEDF